MTKTDMLILWFGDFLAALVLVAARLGQTLFRLDIIEPEDPILAAHWHRRRRWLAVSEFMALPAFASIALTSTIYFNLPPIASVGISMVLGALGFGFLLDALQNQIRKKLEKFQ